MLVAKNYRVQADSLLINHLNQQKRYYWIAL